MNLIYKCNFSDNFGDNFSVDLYLKDIITNNM